MFIGECQIVGVFALAKCCCLDPAGVLWNQWCFPTHKLISSLRGKHCQTHATKICGDWKIYCSSGPKAKRHLRVGNIMLKQIPRGGWEKRGYYRQSRESGVSNESSNLLSHVAWQKGDRHVLHRSNISIGNRML